MTYFHQKFNHIKKYIILFIITSGIIMFTIIGLDIRDKTKDKFSNIGSYVTNNQENGEQAFSDKFFNVKF